MSLSGFTHVHHYVKFYPPTKFQLLIYPIVLERLQRIIFNLIHWMGILNSGKIKYLQNTPAKIPPTQLPQNSVKM